MNFMLINSSYRSTTKGGNEELLLNKQERRRNNKSKKKHSDRNNGVLYAYKLPLAHLSSIMIIVYGTSSSIICYAILYTTRQGRNV